MVRYTNPLLRKFTDTNAQSNASLKRSGPIAPGVAFVTGGARGLGNAIAVAFAKEGARGVVIVDINEAALEEGKNIIESYGTKV